MIRTDPKTGPRPVVASLAGLRQGLITRRRFLVGAAGGSVAALLGVPTALAEPTKPILATIERAQEHLLPSEAKAPGAREVNALQYLRFVLDDERVDAEERAFLLTGAASLQALSRRLENAAFVALDEDQRERVLRQMTNEPQGELWISTLLLYLLEALLCAPAYGGNPNGIGWKWLEHQAGFPLPDEDHIYPRLPL